ncbi:MAG: enoyl-CoA hydratase/isomerase family protein [Bacteroidetes bacterium]|nr:enoyl-CoA hydratase/isomerase family protein [Bacteroidota bacterium]
MTQDIAGGYITTSHEHGITTIEFFHPQSNSLPGAMLYAIALQIHAEGINERTKVIVLRSGGEKAFCAGASFDELMSIQNEAEGFQFFNGFAHLINDMRKCPKLIIARIHGKCVGGGVGLAAAADYAIAVEGADVKLSELGLGIGPFVVGPAVERKIGLSSFSQLAIDAALWRPADWARRKGLYAELHNDVAGMDDSINRLSTTLSHYSPEAMKNIKDIFWKGTEHWDDLLKERAKTSGRLILSEYSRNYIAQFKNKNK